MATYTPVAYTTAASNTQIDFDVTFTFLRSTDVVVSVIDPSGNVLVDGSDYDAELQALNNGTFDMRVVAAGTLNTTQTPLAANHVISLKRNTDISQLATVFQDGASFKAADINALITQLFNKIQEVEVSSGEGIGLTDDLLAFDAENKPLRNLGTPTANNDAMRKIDIDSGIGPDISAVAGIASDVTTLSSGTDTSGRLHRLNIEDVADDLNLGANSDITTVATDIRTGGNNHVQAVSNSIADVNTLAGNDTDGTAHLVNIETVAEDLAGSNTIGTVAGIASAVSSVAADAADIGVVAADIQVGGPDTIGTVAGIAAAVSNVSSISAAVTSVNGNSANINTVAGDTSAINTLATGTDSGGTAYLTHLANASTNAAAAQAALTAFNRTYLGAYSADPTVDGNGDALTDGDLYYNTTDEVLKFYNDTDDSWVTLNNSVQVNAATTLGAVGDANFGTLLENDFIVRDGSNPAKWVNKTPAQARTSLGLGTAAVENVGAFATAAQGGLADAAVQPADLATVATSGSYNDLTNLPTLGTAAAAATGDFATATQGGKADTALQPNASADFGSNRILYSNMWDTSSETLPSASTYHGMFLHDHNTGLAYFAHAGSWQALQNEITTSTALAAASLTTVTDAGNTVDVRRADRIAQASSTNVDGGATLYDVTSTATLTLSDLVAGDIVTVFSRSGTTTVARGTITNMHIDGDTATNSPSVVVGAGTLATVTMVSDDTAIIAGSDLT